MDSTNETLLDRFRALNVRHILSHNLTPISIGVLVLGVALVALGPARGLAASAQPSGASAGQSGAQGFSVAFGPESDAVDQLSRSLIPFTTIPDRPRKDVTNYTIKAGDTLFGIAGEFGLKPETIFWSNKGTLNDNIHLISPGVTIVIMPVDGVYTIADGKTSFAQLAKTYSVSGTVDPNSIINSQYNHFSGKTPDDDPAWGTPVVIPGGTSTFSVPAVITASTSSSGSSGSSSSSGGGQVTYGFMQGMAGSCYGVKGGGGTTAWISPLSSYTVTQPFAPWHSGIDLANVLGTPVHAADTGVVAYSGWVPANWGYGQLVVLDHGNGWTTYYAHLNSIAVRCGQTVPRGGLIGAVGTTGNSSGPHLHFETRWQNVPTNPASIIGF